MTVQVNPAGKVQSGTALWERGTLIMHVGRMGGVGVHANAAAGARKLLCMAHVRDRASFLMQGTYRKKRTASNPRS